MLRYYAAATALKIFSAHPSLERVYRSLGSIKTQLRPNADAITWKYKFRTSKFLAAVERYIDRDRKLDVLEFGTGWIHWESLALCSMYKCKCTVYDVVDCRDPIRLRRVLQELADPRIRSELGFPETGAFLDIYEKASKTTSYSEAYEHLGFEYVLGSGGDMKMLPSEAFDLVVSSDVFEHLKYDDIGSILGELFRVMRPGAIAYHQIVLTDHLKIYAPSIHAKQYLQYSNSHWSKFLSNGIQYINRVQLPEWRELLSSSGLSILQESRIGTTSLDGVKVDQIYSGIGLEDLACTVVQFVLRKPAADSSSRGVAIER